MHVEVLRGPIDKRLSSWVQTLIDQTDHQISDWIGTVLPDTTISLGPPGTVSDGRGVSLYLMELAPSPPLRGSERPPLQIELRYLVTTWAEAPDEAHRLLAELLFAALERSDLEVDLRLLTGEIWNAFGIAPVPSFVLRAPVRRARPHSPAPPVRVPLRVEPATLGPLFGTVRMPDGTPLPGAKVELAELELDTRTDRHGRFRFPSVPSGHEGSPLRVTVKGRTVRTILPTVDVAKSAMVIEFDPGEE
jgi:hypothetical protein